MLSESEIISFRQDLLSWFGRAQRDLPWRLTRDPYAIWVSEAMLQQTRVAAALPYYRNFVAQFPDFRALAQAAESDLLSAWAGLGYYYRARNLQKAAQMMCLDGGFPDSYDKLRALPGVGDYTAAAVASIAFGLPHAVLDGNVFRVLARLLGDGTDISSSVGRKHFSKLAETVLHRSQPGAFNQAMMELGATVCLPRNPQCLVCPVSQYCRANREGRQQELPVNGSKQKPVREDRVLFWVEKGTSLLAWQRSQESRLMPGFWELPEAEQVGPAVIQLRTAGSFRHSITFHSYSFEVVEAEARDHLSGCEWLPLDQISRFPISTIFRKAAALIAKYRTRNTRSISAKAAQGRLD